MFDFVAENKVYIFIKKRSCCLCHCTRSWSELSCSHSPELPQPLSWAAGRREGNQQRAHHHTSRYLCRCASPYTQLQVGKAPSSDILNRTKDVVGGVTFSVPLVLWNFVFSDRLRMMSHDTLQAESAMRNTQKYITFIKTLLYLQTLHHLKIINHLRLKNKRPFVTLVLS